MSDDLVKRLRADMTRDEFFVVAESVLTLAADRIAELEAKLRYYKHEVVETALANEKDAEAKLAKAVEALQSIAGKVPYADDPWDIACVALKELEESPKVGVASGSQQKGQDR